MKIFVATSYSSQVDYASGAVLPAYKAWLEAILSSIEQQGHIVFCALRADNYAVNSDDPAAAFKLDLEQLELSDVVLALLNDKVSAGVQTEIGAAVALKKRVLLAHLPEHPLVYFNQAMVMSGAVQAVELPLTVQKLQQFLQ